MKNKFTIKEELFYDVQVCDYLGEHDAVLFFISKNNYVELRAGGCFGFLKRENDGNDVILTIGTADLSAGVVDFYCLWRPLSSGSSVTVTTPA